MVSGSSSPPPASPWLTAFPALPWPLIGQRQRCLLRLAEAQHAGAAMSRIVPGWRPGGPKLQRCCLGCTALGNSAISTALLSKLARSWPGFVPRSSLHVLCRQSVCGQCKGPLPPLHHCTAAFADGAVAVLSERRETDNEEVGQQLSECRGTNQAVRSV